MSRKRLGQIPFFSKWKEKRQFRKLERRADDLKGEFCKLSDDIKHRKSAAGRVFSKDDYDRLTGEMEDHLTRACECAGAAKKDPKGVGKDVEKECKKAAAEKMGWDSLTGHVPNPKSKEPVRSKYKEYEKFLKDCQEKGGESD